MSSRPEFWETMKILVDRDFKRNINDDIKDYMDNFVKKFRTTTITDEDECDESAAARKRKISECSGIDVLLDEDVRSFLSNLEKNFKNVDCRYESFILMEFQNFSFTLI